MGAMRSRHEHKDNPDGPSDRELKLLAEVQRSEGATQRDLSRRVGIALGVTNMLLRNLAQKGYIQVTHAGWKRWLYALTPAGFSRKIQLTMAYIHRTLNHYQKVRETLREEMECLELNLESRVAIYGTGEFAELVFLGLKEKGIEEIEIYSRASPDGRKFLGMPVYDVSALRPHEYDRVIIASLDESRTELVALQEAGVAPEKIVTFFTNHGPKERV